MAVITYRGYRLIAMSCLPISSDTLVYGSRDGGHTVYDLDPLLKAKIRACCEELGLAGHTVGLQSSSLVKDFYGPGMLIRVSSRSLRNADAIELMLVILWLCSWSSWRRDSGSRGSFDVEWLVPGRLCSSASSCQ